MNMNICLCGCGEMIPEFSKYDTTVKRRYKLGHNRRLNRKIDKIKCLCGCGLLIENRNRNGPLRYKHGHNNKRTSTVDHRYVKGGYIMLYRPTHPSSTKSGYIREHRLIMENYIGRYLNKDEDVHHINGDRLDNRINNLQLISKSEHTELHWKIGKRHRPCN